MLIQSHYIKKILKQVYMLDKSLVSTPMNPCEQLVPHKGESISQLEYSKIIGSLMYAMPCTRYVIGFAMG